MDGQNFINKLQNKPYIGYILIALFVFVIYFPSLNYGLVYLDDNVIVHEQYQFNKNLSNIPKAFEQGVFGGMKEKESYYRPILRLSLMFDAQFGEKNVIFMSHLTNIVLHIMAMCLLFYLLHNLKIRQIVAILFVLILSVHPLFTQTVSLVAGRNDSLLAVFALSALIFFIKYLKDNKTKHLILHFIFFILALWTKETALILPGIFLTYLLIFENLEYLKKGIKKYLTIISIWLVIIIAWFLERYAAIGAFIGNAQYEHFLQSIFNNSLSIMPAIGKVFLPINLATFPVLADMSMVYGVISILVLTTWFASSKNKDKKMLLFGITWFFLFVVLTLIKPTNQVPEYSENRLYLPAMGFVFIILGLGKVSFIDKILQKIDRKILTNILLTLFIFVFSIFSTLTFQRNKNYRDGLSFWKNAVATSPSHAFNHNNLGAMYYLIDDYDSAKNEFELALSLNPEEHFSNQNLGLIYLDEDKLEKAKLHLEKEIELNPNYAESYFDLSLVYYKEKNYAKAKKFLEKTLDLDPSSVRAINNLKIIEELE